MEKLASKAYDELADVRCGISRCFYTIAHQLCAHVLLSYFVLRLNRFIYANVLCAPLFFAWYEYLCDCACSMQTPPPLYLSFFFWVQG
jgi:hypothetical protein